MVADNPASLAVSRRLGYREDGCETRVRRGQPARMVRLLLDRAAWSEHRTPWPLEIPAPTDATLALLGAR